MYLFSPSSQNHITYRGQITPTITIYTTKTTTTTSLNPKNLRSAMDPQQISQGRPHVLFSSIIFLSKFILSVTSLIDESFFICSINVNLGLPLPFFNSLNFFFFFWMSNSLNLDQLTLSYRCINRPPLNMTKSSQATLSHLFISRNYPYLFKWISSFQILSFSLFSLIHINILILVTLIL